MSNETRLSAELCLQIALKTGVDGKVLSGLWYVGVILSIMSSIASNLGVNVQKYSMMQEIKKVKENEAKTERPYMRQPIWFIGLVLVIAGAIGDFSALGFAAQSLATPVGGFTIVANIFFGHFWLKESIGKRDFFATTFILTGIVFVALSADKTEKTYTLDCLLELYKRDIFIMYVVVVVAICSILLFCTLKLAKLRTNEPNGEAYSRYKRIHPILPAALSGIIGSQSVLFAKCTAEIMKITFQGESQLGEWQTYLIIFCMIVTILNQLHWLAHSLRFFDAVLIVPLFQCFFILGGVVGGAVFFDEFSNLSQERRLKFAVGLFITIIGVYILSFRKHCQSNLEESSSIYDDSEEVEVQLKNRVTKRLSKVGDGGNFQSIFGMKALYSSDDLKISENPVYQKKNSGNLEDPASVPNREGTFQGNESMVSNASAPAPLGVEMPQFAMTDLLMGVKDEIKNLGSFAVPRRVSVGSKGSQAGVEIERSQGFTLKRFQRRKRVQNKETEATLEEESTVQKTEKNGDYDEDDSSKPSL